MAAIVAADVLRRAVGPGPAPSVGVSVEAGSLASQHTTERLLARQGHDRASAGRHGFAERVKQVENDTRSALADLAGLLGVPVVWPAATTETGSAAIAARTAFVRLFEEGLIEEAERVVAVCTRCATPISGLDIEPAAHEADLVTLRVTSDRGPIEVETFSLEFLPGVVAIAVVPGDPRSGGHASVPFTEGSVPVVAVEGVTVPMFLAAAHDPEAWLIARERGIIPVPVLDEAGVVRAEGPLAGLGRYAARTAARERLAATGAIVRVQSAEELAPRCRECGTAVVPVLGRQWVLAERTLRRAAADAIREGDIRFAPGTLRDEFMVAASEGGEWILSGDLWAGVRVPAAACLDCGAVTVELDTGGSCGRCFGALEPDRRSLDSHFVAAIWLLAATGWPQREDGPWHTAVDTALVVTPTALASWVVPAAALALRLCGVIPFAQVIAHEARGPDLVAPFEPTEVRAARMWLSGGATDIDDARTLLDALDHPDPGAPELDYDALAASMAAAIADRTVAGAAEQVATALSRGVPPPVAARMRRLTAQITGR
ncbi:MAG: class I tRNA ligase family protein [Acidimicrobiales bacterium]